MGHFLLKRLLLVVPTFLGLTLVTFLVLELVPDAPLSTAGEAMEMGGQGAREAHRLALGLDRPLHVRYVEWLWAVVRLDFGMSSYDHRPVMDKVGAALPITLMLSGTALLLAFGLGIPLGLACAARAGSRIDRLVTGGLFVLHAVPSYWAAIVLILLLAGAHGLALFEPQGIASPGIAEMGLAARLVDVFRHLALPLVCLAYAPLATVSRYVRSSALEELGKPYVRAARAKGLSERDVLRRHVARNALVPGVALAGLYLPAAVGGSVLVETIFGIPGMGRLAFQAVASRDHATILAITTLAAMLTMGGLLLSDVLHALAEPRVRRARPLG